MSEITTQNWSVKDSFQKINSVSSRCKHCLQILKNYGNTTNLRNHLRRKHPLLMDNILDSLSDRRNDDNADNVDIVNNSETDVCSSNESSSTSQSTNMSSASRSVNMCTISNTSGSKLGPKRKKISNTTHNIGTSSISNAFKKIDSFADGGEKASQILKALLFMLAKDGLPLSTTEKEGFQWFMRIVAPLYKVPSRSIISNAMDLKYDEISQSVKNDLLTIKSIVLTTDVWTEPYTTTSYLGLTMHYLDREVFQCRTINVIKKLSEKHTSEYLSKILLSICDEWNIKNKVLNVITDNAANIVKAVSDIFGRNNHIPCFAHTINLVVRKSIDLTPEFKEIINKVKVIVTFVKRSVHAADNLRKLQLQAGKLEGTCLKLIQDCETRWNSTFYMLQRFLELEDYVNMILRKENGPEMLTRQEMVILSDGVNILSPFEEITKEISGEQYITISKIIPMINCLIQCLHEISINNEIGTKFLTNIYAEIKRRFHTEPLNIENSHFHSIATLLDPRFKRLHFQSALSITNAISAVSKILSRIKQNKISDNKKIQDNINIDYAKKNIWNFHEQLKTSTVTNDDTLGGISTELRQYLNSPVINRTANPIEYWCNIQNAYPNLSEIAFQYLLVVGTSVPSERLFSEAGNIISEKRSRLLAERASKLIFLGSIDKKYWNI